MPEVIIDHGQDPHHIPQEEAFNDLPPINGPDNRRDQARWGYTEGLKNHGYLDKDGFYFNVRSIDRNATNFSGEFVDARSVRPGAEAIYVNSDMHPEGYAYTRQYFDGLIGTATAAVGGADRLSERVALDSVFQTIKATTDYDLPWVKRRAAKARNENESAMVPLSDYMGQGPNQKGRAVCRHMAVECAWLGNDGVKRQQLPLTGQFNVHANSIDEVGGHAWARYTSEDGTVYIMDVAQDFFGTLDEAYAKYQAELEGKERTKTWDYFLEGERKHYAARYAAAKAIKGASGQERPQSPEENTRQFERSLASLTDVESVTKLRDGRGVRANVNQHYPLLNSDLAKAYYNIRGEITAAVKMGPETFYIVRALNDEATVFQPISPTPRNKAPYAEVAGLKYNYAMLGATEMRRGWDLAHGIYKDQSDGHGYIAFQHDRVQLGRKSATNNPRAVNGGLKDMTKSVISKDHATFRFDNKGLIEVIDSNSTNGTTVYLGDKRPPPRRR